MASLRRPEGSYPLQRAGDTANRLPPSHKIWLSSVLTVASWITSSGVTGDPWERKLVSQMFKTLRVMLMALVVWELGSGRNWGNMNPNSKIGTPNLPGVGEGAFLCISNMVRSIFHSVLKIVYGKGMEFWNGICVGNLVTTPILYYE